MCDIESKQMDNLIFKIRPEGLENPETGLIRREEILVFDTETTGLNRNVDNILQFSAIDGNGQTLMNQLFHPDRVAAWPQAQSVNHISPEDVADAPLIAEWADRILDLFRRAHLIVAYNIRFDYNMLLGNLPGQRGELCHIIKHSANHHVYDVMWRFPAVYAHENPGANPSTKPQKLGACAAYYGFQGGRLHDALEDARATLHCFYKVAEAEEKYGFNDVPSPFHR